MHGTVGQVYERIFQSALPLRGATDMGDEKSERARFQSALPLRGAT